MPRLEVAGEDRIGRGVARAAAARQRQSDRQDESQTAYGYDDGRKRSVRSSPAIR